MHRNVAQRSTTRYNVQYILIIDIKMIVLDLGACLLPRKQAHPPHPPEPDKSKAPLDIAAAFPSPHSASMQEGPTSTQPARSDQPTPKAPHPQCESTHRDCHLAPTKKHTHPQDAPRALDPIPTIIKQEA